MVKNLCDITFKVGEIGSQNIAMVTNGGVDTKEINSKTMKSNIVDNLYVVGELLDVDGKTGGYNIQWAFSSGYLGAMDINI